MRGGGEGYEGGRGQGRAGKKAPSSLVTVVNPVCLKLTAQCDYRGSASLSEFCISNSRTGLATESWPSHKVRGFVVRASPTTGRAFGKVANLIMGPEHIPYPLRVLVRCDE